MGSNDVGAAFSIDRAFVESVLTALRDGTPIKPTDPRGWNNFEMQVVAGVCLFGLCSHGPALAHELTGMEPGEIWDRLERVYVMLTRFVSQIAVEVADGEYEQNHDSNVLMGAAMLFSGDNEVKIVETIP